VAFHATLTTIRSCRYLRKARRTCGARVSSRVIHSRSGRVRSGRLLILIVALRISFIADYGNGFLNNMQ
jgi:hypothetical protein